MWILVIGLEIFVIACAYKKLFVIQLNIIIAKCLFHRRSCDNSMFLFCKL